MNLQYIYTPGAGKMPRYLAGRDNQIDAAISAFDALSDGEVPVCIAYSGYRGVGKTVLLNKLQADAEERGITTYHLEVREDGRLIPRLLEHCRDFLNAYSSAEKLKNLFLKGSNALKSLELGFSPDSGSFSLSAGKSKISHTMDYAQSMENLFEAMGSLAKNRQQPVCFFIDEFQYAKLDEMDIFLGALHRLSQLSYPVIAIVCGTPEMITKMYAKKTYVERLFIFPDLMYLSNDEVEEALNKPGEKVGLIFDNDAVKTIHDATCGYPYFVQVYGQILCKSLLNIDLPYTISGSIAKEVYDSYIKYLDDNFYKIRVNDRSRSEQDLLFAMANLPLPCTTNDIAHLLKKTNKQIAPTIAKLKAKGIISTGSGIHFTVPGFTDYLKRR